MKKIENISSNTYQVQIPIHCGSSLVLFNGIKYIPGKFTYPLHWLDKVDTSNGYGGVDGWVMEHCVDSMSRLFSF